MSVFKKFPILEDLGVQIFRLSISDLYLQRRLGNTLALVIYCYVTISTNLNGWKKINNLSCSWICICNLGRTKVGWLFFASCNTSWSGPTGAGESTSHTACIHSLKAGNSCQLETQLQLLFRGLSSFPCGLYHRLVYISYKWKMHPLTA